MINSGYDINSIFEDGITPLISASHYGRFEIVELLVKAGTNINTVDVDYYSPLFYAKYRQFEDIVDFLTPLTNLELREIVQQKLEY